MRAHGHAGQRCHCGEERLRAGQSRAPRQTGEKWRWVPVPVAVPVPVPVPVRWGRAGAAGDESVRFSEGRRAAKGHSPGCLFPPCSLAHLQPSPPFQLLLTMQHSICIMPVLAVTKLLNAVLSLGWAAVPLASRDLSTSFAYASLPHIMQCRCMPLTFLYPTCSK